MKILVTGATGFIGRQLAKALVRERHEVYCVYRKQSDTTKLDGIIEPERRLLYDGTLESLTNELGRAKVDAVIHLASLFIAEHKSADVTGLLESNVTFPTFLLEAMKSAGCKRLINTGTSWQHFENQTYNPVCLYASTKQAFEDVCRFYHEAHGLNVIHLHLSDSYGPQDPRGKVISLLKRLAQTGESLGMSPGEQLIDIVHIDDIVRAYLAALKELEKGPHNATFAVSSGQPVSLKELARIAEKAAGRPISIRWGERPYRQREMMQNWSTGKSLPGWRPQVDLETGLKELFHD